MRFEIIKPIGSGATGVVYLARDTVKGNIVALKQLRPDVAFPQQEVLLAQKVTHPNVCRMHEFFVENGVAQISMEYVEGENLRSVIDRYRAEAASAAVPFDEALGILRQVMDGLEEAHRQGVVHRDLKPENILCRPDRKSTRLNSSHDQISYAVFCLKKKKQSVADHPAPCQRPDRH